MDARFISVEIFQEVSKKVCRGIPQEHVEAIKSIHIEFFEIVEKKLSKNCAEQNSEGITKTFFGPKGCFENFYLRNFQRNCKRHLQRNFCRNFRKQSNQLSKIHRFSILHWYSTINYIVGTNIWIVTNDRKIQNLKK